MTGYVGYRQGPCGSHFTLRREKAEIFETSDASILTSNGLRPSVLIAACCTDCGLLYRLRPAVPIAAWCTDCGLLYRLRPAVLIAGYKKIRTKFKYKVVTR